MPETFSPITWRNNQTPALNEVNLNRLEVGVEVIDDRVHAIELGITTPIPVPYSTSVTLNATQGSFFRCLAAGPVTLDQIVGGTDGQLVTFEVWALGGSRTLAFTGLAETVQIPAGTSWTGQWRYRSDASTWVRQVTSGGPAGDTATSTVVELPYASTISLDSRAGDIFRVSATGNITLGDIINGTDGRRVGLDIKASGLARSVTVSGVTEIVPDGWWWSGEFRYLRPVDTWILLNSSILGAPVPGSSDVYPAVYLATY